MDENKQNNEPIPAPEEESNVKNEGDELEVVVDTTEQPVLSEEQISMPNHGSAPVANPTYTYKWDYTSQSAHDSTIGKGKQKNGLLTYATILSVAFFVSIALLIGVMIFGSPDRTYQPSSDASAGASIADLYDFCLPSYVAISTISEDGLEGAGSGIIMTADGYICTNEHVVEKAKTIKVILSDERMYTAEYIDGDALNDIAIIKINVHGLTPALIGSSKDSSVGDRVMAIGTPYGIEYRGTMTSGFISALDRQHVLRNESGTVNKVQKLIQTDTSVNPGNSGGPLFNMNGEVIGVVAMKIAGSQYEGMGFAIPIESVMDMINDIIENGKITDTSGGAKEGAALGISGYDVRKDVQYVISGDYHYEVAADPKTGKPSVKYPHAILNDYLYLPLDDPDTLASYDIVDFTFYTAPASGVRVIMTTPGFHSNVVLKVDDVIVSVNGITSESIMSTIQNLIPNYSAGDILEFEVYRDGEILKVSVELGRSSAMESAE